MSTVEKIKPGKERECSGDDCKGEGKEGASDY